MMAMTVVRAATIGRALTEDGPESVDVAISVICGACLAPSSSTAEKLSCSEAHLSVTSLARRGRKGSRTYTPHYSLPEVCSAESCVNGEKKRLPLL